MAEDPAGLSGKGKGMPYGSQSTGGLLYALCAFGFWGLVPIYFKALQHVPAMEVLAHRVFWSVPVTVLMLSAGRGWKGLVGSVGSTKVLLTLLLSATLVIGNWFVFIYAVQSGKVLEASLGYYINPLVNVILGTVFLGERLRRTQVAVVLLAGAGTLNLVVSLGVVPWIALLLAGSFGLYGLIRKTVAVEPVEGLLVETVLIAPFALGYLLWLGFKTQIAFGLVDTATTVLLALAGAVTVLPLVWFTHAARRLPLSTLGLTQYLAPTIQFLLGALVYAEPFGWRHLVTFSCIWAGVAIFAVEAWTLKRSRLR